MIHGWAISDPTASEHVGGLFYRLSEPLFFAKHHGLLLVGIETSPATQGIDWILIRNFAEFREWFALK